MCFSATASFTTAAVLTPVGIYCVTKAASLQRAYWLFALMPFMFGMQQFFEGVVWLGLASDDGGTTLMAARGYIFFSHLFWLIWIPLACYAVEDNAKKRKFYFILAILGAVHGLSMYAPLLIHDDRLLVKVIGDSIKYKLLLPHDEYIDIRIMNLLYAIFTLIPLLSASDRYIKVFGVIMTFSLVMTSLYFEYTIVSVWCFFAALLSLYILFMISQKTKSDGAEGASSPPTS